MWARGKSPFWGISGLFETRIAYHGPRPEELPVRGPEAAGERASAIKCLIGTAKLNGIDDLLPWDPCSERASLTQSAVKTASGLG